MKVNYPFFGSTAHVFPYMSYMSACLSVCFSLTLHALSFFFSATPPLLFPIFPSHSYFLSIILPFLSHYLSLSPPPFFPLFCALYFPLPLLFSLHIYSVISLAISFSSHSLTVCLKFPLSIYL